MLIDEYKELAALNQAINRVLELLNNLGPASDDYPAAVDQLTKLTKIKQIILETKQKNLDANQKADEFQLTLEQKRLENIARENEQSDAYAIKKREVDLKQLEAEKPDRVSKDALVAAGASLAGILVIVSYEKLNVIASKALGFVLKR